MVKVLANGDVVSDDDPRAGGRSNASGDAESNRPRQVHASTRHRVVGQVNSVCRLVTI